MGKLCAVFFFPSIFHKVTLALLAASPNIPMPSKRGQSRKAATGKGMEGMEGMKPCWKQVLMEIFPFFFFWGGEKVGMEIFDRGGVRPKNGWRKHFEGSFCQSHGAARKWTRGQRKSSQLEYTHSTLSVWSLETREPFDFDWIARWKGWRCR